MAWHRFVATFPETSQTHQRISGGRFFPLHQSEIDLTHETQPTCLYNFCTSVRKQVRRRSPFKLPQLLFRGPTVIRNPTDSSNSLGLLDFFWQASLKGPQTDREATNGTSQQNFQISLSFYANKSK